MAQVRVSYDNLAGQFVAELICCAPEDRDFARGRTIGAAIQTLFGRRDFPTWARKYRAHVEEQFNRRSDRDWQRELPHSVSIIPFSGGAR